MVGGGMAVGRAIKKLKKMVAEMRSIEATSGSGVERSKDLVGERGNSLKCRATGDKRRRERTVKKRGREGREERRTGRSSPGNPCTQPMDLNRGKRRQTRRIEG